ncbi:flagellar motor protein MotB [Amaricoccus sp.]|uniref:flagellar motor protein MotB n=2 Tax=Amaricoccus sp. TaxID=1872485 RepID=UPI002BE1ECBF|nr:flagellar motor protein MotB [Amaricoccus sp.]HMQ92271.1 flagellar motor protein MotB [Amaricoccus sp.]HMR59899.1 flagellar motor protein MotB [Amaricoccus sp.]
MAMDRKAKGNVIVIKRKTVVAGGHHGGAWKVAYADFVTAMMAFFLLMWLLSVTDEETRLGLADYFSPTIPIHSTRGGGDGPFDGATMFSQDILARDETGQKGDPNRTDVPGAPDQSLYDIAEELMGGSGDAMAADPLLKHIATRVTDEGLIIEVFDIPGSPLFDANTADTNPILVRLLHMIGRVLSRTANPVAISGHLAATDIGPDAPDPWRLSGERAQISRELLVAAGVADPRLARVAGKADRNHVTEEPSDSRNRRIEITLLRRFEP